MKLLAHKLLISTCLCLATTVTFSQFTFQKTFNSNGDEVANWVTNTATGYLVAGYITTANGNRDGFLLNLDFEGNPIWQKRLGGSGVDQFNAAIETTGGYIVVGETESFGAGGGDLWLLKISTAGTVLWSKTIGGGDTKEYGFDVVPVSGDRLLVSGAQAPVGTTGFNSAFIYWMPPGKPFGAIPIPAPESGICCAPITSIMV